MRIAGNIAELVGNTPLLEIRHFNKEHSVTARILAKLELFNPSGSAKDRAAFAMLQDAEEKGLLGPGSVIIEPTSGNTGIALAAAASAWGCRLILTMPETMSRERINLLRALGAEVVLTPGQFGMQGAIDRAEELAQSLEKSFIPQQFKNPVNPAVHEKTTGEEIWRDTCGAVDIFIAGVGTGGTISGVGKCLKDKKKEVRVIAVEPSGSPVLSGGKPGPHKIQGIGAGFVPEVLNRGVIDEVLAVSEKEAYAACREIVKTEGLLVGISSGAAAAAAVKAAQRPENRDKTIVVLFPDSGDRYLSVEGLYY